MSNLPDQIMDLHEFDESINLMVYGPSGVGKTVFGGSAEKVLFVAVEKGTVSAKRQNSSAKVWPVHEWNDLEAAFTWLQDNPKVFDWVVLDSITEMQQLAIRDILRKAHEENTSRDLDIPAIQDHQKWQNIYKRFITSFVDLPVNVLFTALVRTAEDEDKEQFLTPDIQGKNYQLSQYTCGQMSAYGYMSSLKVALKDEDGKVVLDTRGKKIPHIVRRITWRDTGVIRGKDRYNVLEPYTEDLTLADVHDLISGKVTREDLGQFILPKPKPKAKEEPKAKKTKAAAKEEPKEEPTPEKEEESWDEDNEAVQQAEESKPAEKSDTSNDTENDPDVGDEFDDLDFDD